MQVSVQSLRLVIFSFMPVFRPCGSSARIHFCWNSVLLCNGVCFVLCLLIWSWQRLKISLGEMIAYLPLPGGHIKLSERCRAHILSGSYSDLVNNLDLSRRCVACSDKARSLLTVLFFLRSDEQGFSFLLGWNYWYNWTMILPAELRFEPRFVQSSRGILKPPQRCLYPNRLLVRDTG
jgi:hypothetical protein